MLTTKEAAQRLGLKNTSAVRQLILAGRLHAEKRGRDWMIEDSEIERYQAERRPVGRPKKPVGSTVGSQTTDHTKT